MATEYEYTRCRFDEDCDAYEPRSIPIKLARREPADVSADAMAQAAMAQAQNDALQARVEILEREVERLRVLIDVADKNQTRGVPWKVPAVAKPVWRAEGQDAYCEGDATCS